jgi:hypothetical protein
MSQQWGSLRSSAGGLVLITLTAVFLVALSAQCQSRPVPQVASCSPIYLGEAAGGQANDAIHAAGAAMREVKAKSFPELARVDLRVRSFHSASDYFRTRFSLSRFLLLRHMRYFVDVNPAVFKYQAPPDGVCAILAHELVHVVSLSRGNRIRRFSLARLLSKRHTLKFERGADLGAIHRGYGDGLKTYRVWVYAHIQPSNLQQKLHNYFSPEEIAAIQKQLQERPDLFEYWSEHVPTNLQEIERVK